MAKKITGKTMLGELMRTNDKAGMILFEHGLHCVGCGMAAMETLEQGCQAHGMGKEEIDEILRKLNNEDKKSDKKIKKSESQKNIKKLPKEKISANKLKEMIG